MAAVIQKRKLLLALALITLVGLALRLWLLSAIWNNGGSPLLGDEGNYVEAALSLADGAGIPDKWLWIRPPGFIVVAAAVFRLFDGSLFALNLLQIALSTAAIPLLFVLARPGLRLAGSDGRKANIAALGAALLLAINPSLILSANFFLSETLFIFLLLVLSLLIVLLLQPGQRRVWLLAAGAGLAGGAALMVRANSLTFLAPVALLIVFALAGDWRRRVSVAALFGACVVLMLAPWTVRNELHYGRFLPLETTGPYNLYLDNNDLGRKATDAQLWEVENPADRGGVAFAGFVDWVTAHPGDFAGRFVQRLGASIAPDDFAEAAYPVRDKIPGSDQLGHDLFSLAATLAYLLLVGLALAGWLAAQRGTLWWLTGIYVGMYVVTSGLTHNEFRFRLQLFPFLAIYAALALVQLPSVRGELKGSTLQRGLLITGFLLGILWIGFGAPNIAQGIARSRQTAQYLEEADRGGPGAIEAAHAAAELNGTSGALSRKYGLLLAAAGRADDAFVAFKHALDFEPGDYQTRAIYAYELGKTDPAAAAKVIAYVPPTYNLALQSWAWAKLPVAATAQVDVGADDLGLVQGFFPPEQDPSGFSYRWATDTAMVKLATDGGTVLRFSARSLPLPSGEGRPTEVLLDGKSLASLTLSPGWQDYTINLPAGTSGSVEITFKAAAQRASAEDTRRLSIAIDKASIGTP